MSSGSGNGSGSSSSSGSGTRFRGDAARSHRVREELSRGADVWTLFNPVEFPTAINLGQGFMNWQPPSYILEQLNADFAARVDLHHYSHPKGRPRLRAAISDYYSASFELPGARALDTETEIQITSGANGGMYSAMGAFVDDGDRVVCLEPFFDQYDAEIRFHGGEPVYVPLIPPRSGGSSSSGGGNTEASEWQVDWAGLDAALAGAKAVILNTPHNPVGKVFTRAELARFAALVAKHDVLVISDEVYDCLTFDGVPHTRLAALPGMWERTLTVGSAGKSFACTGWRVGWLVGPEHLIAPTRAVHTRITFAVNSGAQEGAAIGLEHAHAHAFFDTQLAQYDARRAALRAALDQLGLPYTIPQGSYFILADISHVRIPADFDIPHRIKVKAPDYHVAWFIAKTCDVVAIPATAFYSDHNAHIGARFVRFSFCKDAQIPQAAERLQKVSLLFVLSCRAV